MSQEQQQPFSAAAAAAAAASAPTTTSNTTASLKYVSSTGDDEEEPRPTDIIEINVGGELFIQCYRRTLCLVEESMFAQMFSGRWNNEGSRDSKGRIFLDHDPELIKIIINHLRIKSIEDPYTNPIPPPTVKDGKKVELFTLLRYFGLYDCFFPYIDPYGVSSFMHGNVEIVQNQDNVLVTNKNNGRDIVLTSKKIFSLGYFVACKPSLISGSSSSSNSNDDDNGCFWKVTIESFPSVINNPWLFMGIIGTLNGASTSHLAYSSYGWACQYQVYCQGRESGSRHVHKWSKFIQGETLHFYFSSTKRILAMYSVLKDDAYILRNLNMEEFKQEGAFIHFNFVNVGTKLVLSSMNYTEREEMKRKLSV